MCCDLRHFQPWYKSKVYNISHSCTFSLFLLFYFCPLFIPFHSSPCFYPLVSHHFIEFFFPSFSSFPFFFSPLILSIVQHWNVCHFNKKCWAELSSLYLNYDDQILTMPLLKNIYIYVFNQWYIHFFLFYIHRRINNFYPSEFTTLLSAKIFYKLKIHPTVYDIFFFFFIIKTSFILQKL